MSIWMWSMKLRFQIGSNRPLAKRNARMFCAASLPRKWSMRKTCDSSKTLVDEVVELHRALEVVPERLLHDHAGAGGEVGVAQHLHHGLRGPRGHREVVQQPRVVAELRLGLLHRGGQTLGARALGDVAQPRGEVLPGLVLEPVHAVVLDRVLRERPEGLGVDVLHRRADDPDRGGELGLGEVGQARQELALGEVTGAAEQHDDVRDDRVEIAAEGTRPGAGVRDGLHLAVGHVTGP